MSFISSKFHEILLSGFRGVALTRKTGLTDWLTDGRVKTLYPPQLVAWGIIKRSINLMEDPRGRSRCRDSKFLGEEMWRSIGCHSIESPTMSQLLVWEICVTRARRCTIRVPIEGTKISYSSTQYIPLVETTYRDHFCRFASSALASQKNSVTFFSGTTQASFLIFGTEH